jgi:anti-sigma B factor antagonist
MQLMAEQRGDTLVITPLDPRLDAAVAIQFKDGMREHLGNPSPRIVLDMSNVVFLDSSGLGAVVAVMKLFAPSRRLELAALGPSVMRVFRLTRMDSVFLIHPDVPDGFRDAV